jgi:cation diffusion facilitator family transporter
MVPSKQNIITQRWIVIGSVGLLIVKWVAFFLTDSVAILTDALESIVNVVAGFIGLYSLQVSAKPRDSNHPYGHGKIELISASVEGILIGIAGVLIIIESVQRLLTPTPLTQIDFGMLLVGATAIVNYILGSWALNTGRRNHSLALQASGKHLQTDTWSTVGILIGLGILYFTGLSWVDSAVAIGFGLFILYTGYRILRTTVAGIMDEADTLLLERVISHLEEHRHTNWIDLHNMRIIKYGNVIHIDAHMTVPWYFTVNEAHAEVTAVEDTVAKEFGDTVEMFIHLDGCLPFSCQLCQKEDCRVRQHPFAERLVWTLENVTQDTKHHLDPASEDEPLTD